MFKKGLFDQVILTAIIFGIFILINGFITVFFEQVPRIYDLMFESDIFAIFLFLGCWTIAYIIRKYFLNGKDF